ncbi:MAG: hypothetical protein KDC43_30070 [Saprospiraceae bacterium]|nr:hypothetical protein [Saprospiraceae bacterium]
MSQPLTPSIPTLPPETPPELYPVLDAMKSTLEYLAGANNPNTKAVTAAELEAQSAATQVIIAASAGTTTIVQSDPPDTTPPGALTNLQVSSQFSSVTLSWDAFNPSPPIAFVKIYRASVDDSGQAVAVGTSRTLLYNDYVPNSNDYYYWISAVTEAGVEGPLNSGTGTQASSSFDATYTKEVLAGALTALEVQPGGLDSPAIFGTAVIQSAHIQDLAVIDAHILNVGAEKITATELSAIVANLGTVTAGVIVSPDNTFKIDLQDKEILITGPGGQVADDYTIIKNGKVESYEWTGSTHLLSKALTHIETGVANTGETVDIPGYFSSEPSIIVTPRAIQTYIGANSGQDQQLVLSADGIEEYAAGQWRFTANAQLVLAENGGTEPINWTSSTDSTATKDSPVYETEPNTTDLVVNVSLQSVRGTGTAPNYYYRQVSWTVYYRVAGSGGGWTVGATKVKALGAVVTAVSDSQSVTGLTADSYEIYISATYSDAGGTFQSGTGGYEYADPVVRTAADVDVTALASTSGTWSSTVYAAPVLASYSPPAGWSIYQVDYSWQRGYYSEIGAAFWTGTGTMGSGSSSFSSDVGPVSHSYTGTSAVWTYSYQGVAAADNWASKSRQTSSYNVNEIYGSITATVTARQAFVNVRGRIRNAQATIRTRRLITNSTTAANTLTFTDYDYTLSGQTVLGSGTLNWQAIG